MSYLCIKCGQEVPCRTHEVIQHLLAALTDEEREVAAKVWDSRCETLERRLDPDGQPVLCFTCVLEGWHWVEFVLIDMPRLELEADERRWTP